MLLSATLQFRTLFSNASASSSDSNDCDKPAASESILPGQRAVRQAVGQRAGRDPSIEPVPTLAKQLELDVEVQRDSFLHRLFERLWHFELERRIQQQCIDRFRVPPAPAQPPLRRSAPRATDDGGADKSAADQPANSGHASNAARSFGAVIGFIRSSQATRRKSRRAASADPIPAKQTRLPAQRPRPAATATPASQWRASGCRSPKRAICSRPSSGNSEQTT